MDSCSFADLLSWTMLNALNSSVLVEQNQKQRPLTPDEVEACHLKAMQCAEVLRDGYLDGLEAPPFSAEHAQQSPLGAR
jgi:hypothetical protein